LDIAIIHAVWTAINADNPVAWLYSGTSSRAIGENGADKAAVLLGEREHANPNRCFLPACHRIFGFYGSGRQETRVVVVKSRDHLSNFGVEFIIVLRGFYSWLILFVHRLPIKPMKIWV
jgi:hypothetical protein